jgi:hypothetical protein
MNATIRDYVSRRVRFLFAVAALGWLSFPLSAYLFRGRPNPMSGVTAVLPIVGFAAFIGSIVALNWAVKCPRCLANLGRTIAFPVAVPWGRKVNFCPYCGVNLDEPRESQSAGINPIR